MVNEMSVAEYQNQPKYVPRDEATQDSTGPMILLRKTTLTKEQIEKARQTERSSESPAVAAPEHNSLLDCCLCKNVMIKPRECEKCRKGFCKNCIDGYIDQLVAGDYQIVCPNCGTENLNLVEPHPLLVRQLSELKGACINADKGCNLIIAYGDLENHQKECGFTTIKCSLYGCEAEMKQSEYDRHVQNCEYRVLRCEKCNAVKPKEGECDCIKNMVAKCEHLSQKLAQVSKRLNDEVQRNERMREE